MQVFEGRHQTRFFDHENIPSKELIEKVLHKAHELVPSKQNLMPYVVKLLGPEHTEIKKDIYELACEVEYPDVDLRNKKRLDKIKIYEDNNFDLNNRFPDGNSQLFAPYLLLLIPRKPLSNSTLAESYKKMDSWNKDAHRLSPNIAKVEIGMFSVILTGVAMEEGLNISYTACLNGEKLRRKYDWLKGYVEEPTLALSLGYKRPDVSGIQRNYRRKLKGEDKPEKQSTFEWL
jgi:hypothetical protein|tara:strand:- start:583 stop:1278 length:696 start_codon:yes stop_codon:yes gene_type:complete